MEVSPHPTEFSVTDSESGTLPYPVNEVLKQNKLDPALMVLTMFAGTFKK